MWLAKRRLGDSRRPCAPGMVEEPDVSGACAMAKQRTLTSISLLVTTDRTQFCSHEWHGSKFKGPEKTAVGLINSITFCGSKSNTFFLVPQFSGCSKTAGPHAQANGRNNHTIPQPQSAIAVQVAALGAAKGDTM